LACAKSLFCARTYNNTQFSYDPLGRCVKIVETTGGSVTGTKNFIWTGAAIAEERDGSGSLFDGKQFFPLGQINYSGGTGTSNYYSQDHLGSIREMTNSSGNIVAQYGYDPYGQATKLQGSMDADFQYAGMYTHKPSGLYLTWFRQYNPSLGRWLSRDPLGERADATLYSYVSNDPINRIDPLGLAWQLVVGWKPAPITNRINKNLASHGDLFLVQNGKVVASWSGQLVGLPTGGSVNLSTRKGQGAYDASTKQVIASGSDDTLCQEKQKINDAADKLHFPWLNVYQLPGPNSNTALYMLLKNADYTPPTPIVPGAYGYYGYTGPYHEIYVPVDGSFYYPPDALR
jgi:RHS repeat-associated protein